MQIPRHSITTKLLLLFLFVGLSAVLIVGIYSFYSAKKAIMIRTVDQLISVKAVKKQQVEYFFAEKIKNLKNLSLTENIDRIFTGGFSDSIKGQSHEDDFRQLRNYFRTYGFTNLFLVSGDLLHPRILTADSTGTNEVVPVILDKIDRIVDDLKHRDDVAISDLFFKTADDSNAVCLIGYAIHLDNDDSLGAIILEIPASEFNKIMLQDNNRIGLGHSGEAYLVGSDYLMRSASRFLNGSLLRIPVKSETAVLALQGQTGTAIAYDYRGVRVFSAYEPLEVPGLNWVVLAEIDYDEAMVPVTNLRNDILLVSIVISIFILGFAQVITKMVTQPIIRLKNAAARLGEGNFDNKVTVRSKDEIGSLAETFNIMSDQLKEERRKRILALFDGQEIERRRVSRELHDGLGQKLVGTKLQIENCDKDDPHCLRKTMDETKTGILGIVEELRRISNDLMPASLDELGLENALRSLCIDVGRQSGIEVDFDVRLNTAPEENTAIYLFRIAQEGIHNIIKHARASNISMQLLENRDFLIFILEDDGAGFQPDQVFHGNGLSNMKERAGLLGGTFTVESEPGKGTTIRVKIPGQK